MKDDREERKGAIMGHMTVTTIFSMLATVGMVLVLMWGMSIVGPQRQREAAQQPLTYQLVGRKGCGVLDTRSRQGNEVPNDVPTLRWIDGA